MIRVIASSDFLAPQPAPSSSLIQSTTCSLPCPIVAEHQSGRIRCQSSISTFTQSSLANVYDYCHRLRAFLLSTHLYSLHVFRLPFTTSSVCLHFVLSHMNRPLVLSMTITQDHLLEYRCCDPPKRGELACSTESLNRERHYTTFASLRSDVPTHSWKP